MNRRIYDIDLGKLLLWLVPSILRKPRVLALLSAALYPVLQTYQQFLRFKKQKAYELGITPQVCRLEALLNDRFDYTQRRIRIVDSIDRPPTYLYQPGENKPVYLGTRTLYTLGETGALQDDFIVLIPASLPAIETELISLLKLFKLAGTRPKTQRV